MKLIDKTDINDLADREYKLLIWLSEFIRDKDWYKVAGERAALTVRIFNYYKNNRNVG